MNQIQKTEGEKIYDRHFNMKLHRTIMANNIFRFLGSLVCAVASRISKGEFSKITFWKSENGKYLYYCMSEDHVTDENKFRKAFPEAHRISQTEFDLLIYFYPEKQVVEVADSGIADEPFEDESAPDDDTND